MKNPDMPENNKKNRRETASDVAEAAQAFAENWGGKDEKVVHCSKCHGAEQSEKLLKATTVFSLGAFILSIIAIALPFFKKTDVSFDAAAWADFLESIEERVSEPAPAEPQAVNVPVVPNRPTSARPASSAQATVSSASVSVVAVASSAPASSAAASSIPRSSAASSEAPATEEQAGAGGTGATGETPAP